jgi:hypothetical protein
MTPALETSRMAAKHVALVLKNARYVIAESDYE